MAKKKSTKKKTTKKKAASKKAAIAEVPAEEAKPSGKPKKKPASAKRAAKPALAAAIKQPVALTYDQIAARAFVVWERKGKPDGQDAANWKEAEAELLAEAQQRG